jgi:hypothetical protein
MVHLRMIERSLRDGLRGRRVRAVIHLRMIDDRLGRWGRLWGGRLFCRRFLRRGLFGRRLLFCRRFFRGRLVGAMVAGVLGRGRRGQHHQRHRAPGCEEFAFH